MKEMVQIVNTLKEELKNQGDTVAKYEQSSYPTPPPAVHVVP